MKWEEWLEIAEEFYKANGHLRITRDYVTPNGKRLGRWIERQRAAYSGKGTCVMDLGRIKALEAIGIEWLGRNNNQWDHFYKQAKKYYKEFGHLLIPHDYCTKDGLRIGDWINQQRKKYKLKQLSNKQIEKLNDLGMEWPIIKRPTEEQWFKMAKEYFAIYGNVKMAPTYKTKDGYALGMWINAQRSKYIDED